MRQVFLFFGSWQQNIGSCSLWWSLHEFRSVFILLQFRSCKDTQAKNPSRRGLVLSITILFVFELKSTDTSNYTLLKTWLGLVMEGRNREAFNCFFPQIFNSIEQTMLLWKQYKFSPKYHHAHTHQKSQLTVMGRHSRCLKKKKNGFPSRLLLPDCCHYMQTLWGTAVSMIQSAAHINPAINPDPRRLPRCRRPPARLQCMLGHKLPGGQSE